MGGASENPPEGLSDLELLEAVVERGGRLDASAREKLAGVGPIRDDERWRAPLPLRFEAQLVLLFGGALDAYEVTAAILRDRALQQAFSGIRFLLETLAQIRWLVEPGGVRERQVRSYRLLYGQISRWAKLLKEDVAGEPEAIQMIVPIETWEARLRELAREDGLQHLKPPPGRSHLLREYGPKSGYPVFSMLSELGAHPSAVGNLLFSLRPEDRTIDYRIDAAPVERAFWCAVAIVHLWQTCEGVAEFLGWNEWLTTEAGPIYNNAASVMDEATRRRRAFGD